MVRPKLLQELILNHRRKKLALYFYRFYSKIKLDCMVDVYRRDMLCNFKDFVYETPNEIK